jgi:hypothetical protein
MNLDLPPAAFFNRRRDPVPYASLNEGKVDHDCQYHQKREDDAGTNYESSSSHLHRTSLHGETTPPGSKLPQHIDRVRDNER